MSLQRFSVCGEHTRTLTVVAVSLYEQIQDCIYHSSWQSGTDLKITDQAPLTILDSITWMKSFMDPQAAPLLLNPTASEPSNFSDLVLTCITIFPVVQFFSPYHQKLPISPPNTLKYTLKCAYSGLCTFYTWAHYKLSATTNHFLNGWEEWILCTLFKNQNPRSLG